MENAQNTNNLIPLQLGTNDVIFKMQLKDEQVKTKILIDNPFPNEGPYIVNCDTQIYMIYYIKLLSHKCHFTTK